MKNKKTPLFIGICIIAGISIGIPFLLGSDSFTTSLTVPSFIESDFLDRDGTFELSWTTISNAESYELYRSTELFEDVESNVEVVLIFDGSENSTSENTLSVGEYCYRVRAKRGDIYSDLSNAIYINVSYPSEVPTLSIEEDVAEGGFFSITWSSVLHATEYILYRSDQNDIPIETLDPIYSGSLNEYTEQSLEPGTYFYCVVASNGEIETQVSNIDEIFVEPVYEETKLNRFPFSLDLLFLEDNPSAQASRLAGIASGQTHSGYPFIDPYPNYFHHDHYPATMKWYIYAQRYLPISLPVDCYLTVEGVFDNNNATINSSKILKNTGITLHLNYHQRIIFEHVGLNESLYNQWFQSEASTFMYRNHAEKNVFIPANTTFGFTHDVYALDFIFDDIKHMNYNGEVSYGLETMKNPLFAFSYEAQETILSHYALQYEQMVTSGKYIQSYLNRTYDINEANSLFGTWWYKDGPFTLNETHHEMGWYSFDGCIVNLLNINKTNNETFTSYSDGCIGVYADADYPASVNGYTRKGLRYMYYSEGDNKTQVIVQSEPFPSGSSPVFIRIELQEHSTSSLWDDELYIEYFTTLVDAQSGFTVDKFVYERLPEH